MSLRRCCLALVRRVMACPSARAYSEIPTDLRRILEEACGPKPMEFGLAPPCNDLTSNATIVRQRWNSARRPVGEAITVSSLARRGLFVSQMGADTIRAFIEDTTVNHVPLDPREASLFAFHESMENRPKQRVPLLCNSGARGSGKSIQQQINMLRFWVRGGWSVEVTFNDDQGTLYIGQDPDGIAIAVGVRILDRALRGMTGKPIRNLPPHYGRAIEVLQREPQDSIVNALRAVEAYFGLPADTPVLLAVDELSKGAEKAGIRGSEALSLLCETLDENKWVFFSVTAYGCVDLQKFVTNSNRALLLQPLPPIFPVTDTTHFACLPLVLQLFHPEVRKNLPYRPEYLTFYSSVGRLLLESAGHPRRVERLLTRLRTISEKLPTPVKQKLSEKNITSVDGQVIDEISKAVGGSYKNLQLDMDRVIDYDHAVKVFLQKGPPLLATLLKDTVQAFQFPTSPEDADKHRLFLAGTMEGSCHFLPIQDSVQGRAFIPYPALRALGESSPAIRLFCDALAKHFDPALGGSGKPFEMMTAALLLFYTQNKDTFTLAELCRTRVGNGPSLDIKLLGGNVIFREDVTCFPSVFDNRELKVSTMLFETLFGRDDINGVVFAPTDEYNLCADVIGIFRAASDRTKFVVAFIQTKDHFREPIFAKPLVEQWRWSQNFVREGKVSASFDEGAHPTIPNPFPKQMTDNAADPAFILFTPKEPEPGEPLHKLVESLSGGSDAKPVAATKCERGNEALADWEHVREYCPTFGYAGFAANRLSRLWKDAQEGEAPKMRP